MDSGWIKLHRKLLDNPILRHPIALQVLIWAVLSAQRKPYRHATRYGAITLDRGEVMAARRHLSQQLGVTEQNIRTALALLAKESIIEIKSTNGYTIIKLKKYDFFQSSEHDLTSSQPAANQQLTQEQEVREGKKEKKSSKEAATPPALGFDPVAIAVEAMQAEGATILNREPRTIAVLRAQAKKLGEQRFRDAASYYAKDKFFKERGLTLKGLLDNLDKCANAAQATKPVLKPFREGEDF